MAKFNEGDRVRIDKWHTGTIVGYTEWGSIVVHIDQTDHIYCPYVQEDTAYGLDQRFVGKVGFSLESSLDLLEED